MCDDVRLTHLALVCVLVATACGGADVLLQGITTAAAAESTPSPRMQAVAIDGGATVTPSGKRVVVETLERGLRSPWGMAFTPTGDLLLTEKRGDVRIRRSGSKTSDALAGGPPDVLVREDSGLLDVAVDPDFAQNGWVYVAFAEGTVEANRTAIWRARYDGTALRDGRVIFRAQPDKRGTGHPGGRLLFMPDRTLLLSVGDGYEYKSAAQDLGSHLGKMLRLTRDGVAAPDNPFVSREGARPEIYSYGHRNVQGLAFDATTRRTWFHEHGPRGGDEINLSRAGANYGWPVVTHGIDYDGTVISDRTTAPGIERAAFFWAPSIAPSGFAVYRGEPFPDWDGQLLVGALVARAVVRLQQGKDTGLLVEQERLLYGTNKRIRDVRVGPDGWVYLLTDAEDGELLRLRPAPAQ